MPKKENYVWMTAENPLQQLWTMIKTLRSSCVCEKVINRKLDNTYSPDIVRTKAQGVSFLIQNACDYFEVASKNNLTQRLLNLYYGTLAFIEAEILINSETYHSLDDIEKITRQGHGLYTINTDISDVGEILIGVLGENKGLFPAWLHSRNVDISSLPSKKSKDFVDDNLFSLSKLLYNIPELEQLLTSVDSNFVAGFFTPIYIMDPAINPMGKKEGSYVALFDYSETTTIEMTKTLNGDFEQFEPYENRDKIKAYKVYIKHSEDEYWWNKLNIHRSAFCKEALLQPLLLSIDSWEVYATMILYCFSILVRYNPSVWRRVEHGDWDKYFAVCEQFAVVVERVLPNIFYQKITGDTLKIKMPGAFA